MLTIEYIKNHQEEVKKNIIQRGFDSKKCDIEKLLSLETEKNRVQTEVDNLRQKRNENSDSIKNSNAKPTPELIAVGKGLKESIARQEVELEGIKKNWREIMGWIPNMASVDSPIGSGPEDNIEIKAWSKQTGMLVSGQLSKANGSAQNIYQFGSNADKEFVPLSHWEIGKNLDIIDLEAGAKVSGSRFYYLKKEGYLMMYGIFDLLMKKLLADNFIPMYVPLLVKTRALFGSSQFPADQDQIYKIAKENVEDNNSLYLVGSSEPSLFSYYQDTLQKENDLPIKMFATTPCFRSEAGSWGKDVRGIKRMHQFEKMEMDIITKNNMEETIKIHEYLLSINEWLLQTLELPYHVINICTGELGYAAASKKYDVEVFLPNSKSYIEIMSNSLTTDFQSRRLNIKYLNQNNEKNFVYTLNNTGATHRLLIAILEHYQQSDSTIMVPAVLKPYINKEYIGKI